MLFENGLNFINSTTHMLQGLRAVLEEEDFDEDLFQLEPLTLDPLLVAQELFEECHGVLAFFGEGFHYLVDVFFDISFHLFFGGVGISRHLLLAILLRRPLIPLVDGSHELEAGFELVLVRQEMVEVWVEALLHRLIIAKLACKRQIKMYEFPVLLCKLSISRRLSFLIYI